ncbi:hypothetical protein F5Y17DRAFT_251824 [Xylariaceae sp. FL0594]|nr:hypothetical protein F5Y17DRAFT_251824 [Xylariaceae sp. FL0594]
MTAAVEQALPQEAQMPDVPDMPDMQPEQAQIPQSQTQLPQEAAGGGGVEGGGGAKVTMATEADIPELVPIFLDAFSEPAKRSAFPETEGGRRWLERSFANFLGSRSQYRPEAKVPVVRNANGKPVSFAISHIVQQGQNVVSNSWKQRWGDTSGLPDVKEEQLARFFEPLAKVHHVAVGPQAHVFIEFLMTKFASRGKGYASAIVNWATRLADDLNVPCYLDGGGRGMGICERAGFEAQDVEDKYGDIPPSVPMVRPKKQG